MGKLTALGVSSTKLKAGRYGDGAGLYLLVNANGARSWMLRVQTAGRRRDIGLGSLAKLSLAEARGEAARLRKHALNGRDPIVERDRLHYTPKTFREAAVAVHEAKRSGWAAKTADSFLSSLTEHAYPILGHLRVEDVEAADIVRALRPIWNEKPATAAKVYHRIGVVLSYARASKWRTTEAPGRSVTVLLGKRPEGKAMAAMPYADVPAFYAAQSAKHDTVSRLALLFVIATAARSGEVRGAAWEQFDLDNRLWHRPAELMKARKAHSVTLSDEALALLERAVVLSGGKRQGLVFPAARGRQLSDMSISKVMRDASSPFVPHGFRSSFRTWAAEVMPTIPDPVAEAALAHAVPDKVEAAYKRAAFLNMRWELLNGWGAFIAGRSNILPLWSAAL